MRRLQCGQRLLLAARNSQDEQRRREDALSWVSSSDVRRYELPSSPCDPGCYLLSDFLWPLTRPPKTKQRHPRTAGSQEPEARSQKPDLLPATDGETSRSLLQQVLCKRMTTGRDRRDQAEITLGSECCKPKSCNLLWHWEAERPSKVPGDECTSQLQGKVLWRTSPAVSFRPNS